MSSSSFTIRKFFDLTATIAASGTKSNAIDLVGSDLIAVITPSAFTGVALTFEGSADGTTFVPLVDGAGAAVSVTVSTSDYVPLPASVSTLRWVKVVSGSTEAAEREITLVTKPTV